MLPDDLIKLRARKVVDNGVGPHAIPLAQLTESILLNEKLDQLLSKEAPEMPEIEIPEYPKEINVANLPEVQKVEITNLPKEKDDKEVKKLLQELVTEVKKKEQYTYDIEVDPDLKEQLRGEKGDKGEDGSPDTADQIADKLNTLEEKVELSVLKGWKEFLKGISEKTTNARVYGTRMFKNLLDVDMEGVTDGQVPTYNATTGKYEPGNGGSLSDTFETVLRNIKCYPSAVTYNVDNLIDTVVYTLPAGSITQNVTYTGRYISTIVLSGDTPSGIDLVKTFNYTGYLISSITYS